MSICVAASAGVVLNVLAELLDLLDLTRELLGEGLLQRLKLKLLAMVLGFGGARSGRIPGSCQSSSSGGHCRQWSAEGRQRGRR